MYGLPKRKELSAVERFAFVQAVHTLLLVLFTHIKPSISRRYAC